MFKQISSQELAAGANHTCALKVEGTVACWGANGAGQLGDGSSVTRSSPETGSWAERGQGRHELVTRSRVH